MLKIIKITTENTNGTNASTPLTKNVTAAHVIALEDTF